MTRADNRGGTAFTPGPWCVERRTSIFSVRSCDASVANVHHRSGRVATRGEGEANARLIAAAPELFEALNEAVCLIPANQQAALAKFSALLAKATGDAS